MRNRIVPTLALLAAGLLAVANCNNGDKIAPEGSVVDVAAIPTTIVITDNGACTGLLGVAKCGTSDVVATVSSPVGVPLPDQDVRFTNTAGLLFTGSLVSPQPAANLPIRTDQFGNAHVNLVTGSTTTVSARSGKATGSLTLSTTTANISRIELAQDETGATCGIGASSPAEILTCSDEICLVATAIDINGAGIPNLQVNFQLQSATGTNQFGGSFTPPAPNTSDPDGKAFTVLRPDSQCTTKCAAGKCDGVDVVASTLGGFTSNTVHFDIRIP
jgi:hypothetical protein